MLSSRAGTRLDYVKLSRLTGISRETVNGYVDLFEKTYLISRVPVFTKNADREIVKAQKIYFSDNGILNILADLSSGAKFENSLFCQLRHKGNIRYFSLKNGQEIDFVLDDRIALEAKEKPVVSDEKNLINLAKKAGLKEWRLIGSHKSPSFENYIWGGDIK